MDKLIRSFLTVCVTLEVISVTQSCGKACVILVACKKLHLTPLFLQNSSMFLKFRFDAKRCFTLTIPARYSLGHHNVLDSLLFG